MSLDLRRILGRLADETLGTVGRTQSEVVKAVNRSTPWGQAHQNAYNNAPQPTPEMAQAPYPTLPRQKLGGGFANMRIGDRIVNKRDSNGQPGVPYYQQSPTSTPFALPYSTASLPQELPYAKRKTL